MTISTLLLETLKKIAKETSVLEKVIFINIFTENKAFSLIFNIQIEKLFNLTLSHTLYSEFNVGKALTIIKLI